MFLEESDKISVVRVCDIKFIHWLPRILAPASLDLSYSENKRSLRKFVYLKFYMDSEKRKGIKFLYPRSKKIFECTLCSLLQVLNAGFFPATFCNKRTFNFLNYNQLYKYTCIFIVWSFKETKKKCKQQFVIIQCLFSEVRTENLILVHRFIKSVYRSMKSERITLLVYNITSKVRHTYSISLIGSIESATKFKTVKNCFHVIIKHGSH